MDKFVNIEDLSPFDFLDPNTKFLIDDALLLTSHKFDSIFSLINILATEEHEEELEFKTWCRQSCSWEIVIRFQKEIPFNNFNLLVTLRRIDLSDFLVFGAVVIWFLNAEGKTCPVPCIVKGVMDGRGAKHQVVAIDPHFNCLLRDEDHLTLPHDILIVKVELYVKGCCEHKIKDQPPLPSPGNEPMGEGEEELVCRSRL